MATTIKTRFLEAIGRHAMLPAGSRILCAVSGGADSVALLRLLCICREELAIAELSACHINHCLRGEESDRDEAFVRQLCQQWNIPLHVHREDAAAYAAARGLSLEEGARELRYETFARLCPRGGLIATAHTLTDSIETVIINLARGTGLAGLTGIPPVRGNIIRPLIDCTRADIEAFLGDENIAHVTDSTNLTDAYTRNRVRHTILPELARINPGYESAFARTVSLLSRDAAILDEIALSFIEKAATGEGYTTAVLLGSGDLLSRVVHTLLRSHGAPCDHDHIHLCIRVIEAGSGTVQLGAGYSFYAHTDIAYVAEPASGLPDDLPVSLNKADLLNGPLTVWAGNSKLTLSLLKYEQMHKEHEFSKKSLKNVLDYDKIGDILVLRRHRAGDRLSQPGRGVVKTLRKLISEAGVPLHRRGDIIVAQSGDAVVWAQGFGRDSRVDPNSGTDRILLLETQEPPLCGKENG